MKTYSKLQLIALAIEVFVNHPETETVFAREDGNIFFSENYADLDRGKLKVYPLERSEIVKTDVKDTKVKDDQTDVKSIKVKGAKVVSKTKETPPAAVDATLGKDGKNPENRNETKPTV